MPFPSPGDLPNPEIKPGSSALQADSLSTEILGKHVWSPVKSKQFLGQNFKDVNFQSNCQHSSQYSGVPRVTVCSLHDKHFYPDNSLNPHNKFIIPVSQERKGTEPKERIPPSNNRKRHFQVLSLSLLMSG